MISLTRLNGERIALNPELIERGEQTPDTVLTLVNGTKYLVLESLDDVIEQVKLHRASILALSRQLTVERVDEPGARLRLLPGGIAWRTDAAHASDRDAQDPADSNQVHDPDDHDDSHPSFPGWAGQ
ncbi:MAG TPA: flagellar FlbD family protein [Acidimicrobiales bacterium]|nr:flagellar FlbD family protein [Acidimicrobiales bacterium]